MTFRELYEKLEKIGEGTFGKVYKALDRKTKKYVAIKKIRVKIDEEGIAPTTLREISLLKMLNGSNHIVKLLSTHFYEENEKHYVCVILEYLNMDLKNWMDSNGHESTQLLSKKTIKSITTQLLNGIVYCHEHGVMHRDIKPQNILIENNIST